MAQRCYTCMDLSAVLHSRVGCGVARQHARGLERPQDNCFEFDTSQNIDLDLKRRPLNLRSACVTTGIKEVRR